MKVVEFLQNMIIATLIDNNDIQLENIYLSPIRNSEYPYCIVIVDRIEDVSSISENMFNCNIKIDIYDKSNTNETVVNMSDTLKNNLGNIVGNQSELFYIKNIILKQGKLKLFNEINLVWNVNLEFETLIKQLF
jgi:hypothetical protein